MTEPLGPAEVERFRRLRSTNPGKLLELGRREQATGDRTVREEFLAAVASRLVARVSNPALAALGASGLVDLADRVIDRTDVPLPRRETVGDASAEAGAFATAALRDLSKEAMREEADALFESRTGTADAAGATLDDLLGDAPFFREPPDGDDGRPESGDDRRWRTPG